MRLALERAGDHAPTRWTWSCPTRSGCPATTAARPTALRAVFGDRPPPVSTQKPLTGRAHQGGSALDVATALLAFAARHAARLRRPGRAGPRLRAGLPARAPPARAAGSRWSARGASTGSTARWSCAGHPRRRGRPRTEPTGRAGATLRWAACCAAWGGVAVASALAEGWALSAGTVRTCRWGSGRPLGGDRPGRAVLVRHRRRPRPGRRRPGCRLGRPASASDTATALRRDAGLNFVVAPVATAAGAVLHRLGPRHRCRSSRPSPASPGGSAPTRPGTCRNCSTCWSGCTGPPPRSPRAPPPPRRTSPVGPALRERGDRWTGGPYAEPLRALLTRRAGRVVALLADVDRLAARVTEVAPVVTDGEPHPGDLIRTPEGLRLVDWDTVRLASPERDLWLLTAGGDGDGRTVTARTPPPPGDTFVATGVEPGCDHRRPTIGTVVRLIPIGHRAAHSDRRVSPGRRTRPILPGRSSAAIRPAAFYDLAICI